MNILFQDFGVEPVLKYVELCSSMENN